MGLSYAWLCTALKLQRASCQIVSVNSVTYHGINVLRRQGSQVRTERDETAGQAEERGDNEVIGKVTTMGRDGISNVRVL